MGYYNEQAEQAIIQAVVQDKKLDILQQLRPEDFYFQDHQRIMEAISKLYDEHEPIDLVTVDAALKDTAAKKTLVDLATGFRETWAVDKHVAILKECAARRKMASVLDKYRAGLEDQDLDVILDGVRQDLRDMTGAKHEWMSMKDVMLETVNTIAERQNNTANPLPFGIVKIDDATAGLHRGEFTIIGARPSVGKSAFGVQIALAVANNGYKVGVCSREMTAPQYGMRMLQGAVTKKSLRTDHLDQDEWERLNERANQYSRKNIRFSFNTKYVEDLRTEVNKLKDTTGIDLLIVDYVQLLKTRRKFEQDYQRIAFISKTLKDMTVDLDIPIIGLAQVGRSADGDMPTMAELRGSGDLEQDADNIIFLHRPTSRDDDYVQYKDRFDRMQGTEYKYIVVNIAKQRQGKTGYEGTAFNPTTMKFTGLYNG